jgi:PHD/YefM family antitoxin component YafN of YafNO toxin-antitoxin module
MNIIPELVPISQLRQRQNQILAELPKGPIILTQRGVAAAVLVTPKMWNFVVREVENMSDALAALKIELEVATGREEVSDWEAFEAELNVVPT